MNTTRATLTTTAIVMATLAALAGCAANPDAVPHPGAIVCAAAEELFTEPGTVPVVDGEPAEWFGLSDSAGAQLRDAIPTRLTDDLDALISRRGHTGQGADFAATEAFDTSTERLQEWAIRACGIDVAFSGNSSESSEATTGNEIRVSGGEGTVISGAGDRDHALAICEEEVRNGATREVLVLDQFGVAIVSWPGDGPCTLVDGRP